MSAPTPVWNSRSCLPTAGCTTAIPARFDSGLKRWADFAWHWGRPAPAGKLGCGGLDPKALLERGEVAVTIFCDDNHILDANRSDRGVVQARFHRYHIAFE